MADDEATEVGGLLSDGPDRYGETPGGGFWITLSAPITIHGKSGPEQVDRLTFRAPKASDIFAAGHPIRFVFTATGTETSIDNQKIKVFLNRLCSSPDGLGEISAGELQAVIEWLSSELAPVSKN